MKPDTPKTWARAAVAGIILPKERESAQQELLDHILDHKEALLAAGFSREEAERQAVAAMGDAEETAKLLRKAHQPVLTRLMQAARVCAICLAATAVLSVFIAWVMQADDVLPRWFEGKPYPEDQAWFFEQPVDDSILYRRVCKPNAALPVGDYTLRVDKAAVVQYADRWELHLLTEFDGKWPWQDAPIPDRSLTFHVDGQPCVIYGGGPHYQQGSSFYAWYYVETSVAPQSAVLELTRDGVVYSLPLNMEGGDVYEKGR
ncbi:MAG: hypothetical protein IKU58_01435 [Clostridia bacterium]|nr:hypothetical protein [Clostridia bacterium]